MKDDRPSQTGSGDLLRALPGAGSSSDANETAARQMAAFTHLKNMIEKLAGPRFPKNQLTEFPGLLSRVLFE